MKKSITDVIMDNNKKYIVLLFGIILLGFLLRIYQLDSESLWQDEGFTLNEVDKSNLKDTFKAVFGPPEGTPPAYFLLLHFWVKLFGSSDFSLRFPSVLFGVISIYLIFLVGKALFDKKTALIGSLIMSVSMIQILYSQDARAYSFFVLLILLSSLFFIKLIKNYDSKSLVCYFFSTVLLLYTHHFGLFVLLVQNIFFFLFITKDISRSHRNPLTSFVRQQARLSLWYRKADIPRMGQPPCQPDVSLEKLHNKVADDRISVSSVGTKNLAIKRWLLTNLIISLVYIPGIFIIISQFQHNQQSLQSALVNKIGLPPLISQLGILNFLLPIIIIFAISIVFLYFKFNPIHLFKAVKFNENIFFMGTILFFAVYIYFVPRLIHPFFVTRFTIFTYPFFYLLFARGFTKTCDNNLRKIISLIFLTVILLSLFCYYENVKKPQWKEAVFFVETESHPGELIIVLGQSKLAIFNHYYLGHLGVIGVDIFIDQLENQEELRKLVSMIESGQHKGYWLIQSEPYKTKGIYIKYFETEYDLIQEKQFYTVEVYHYI